MAGSVTYSKSMAFATRVVKLCQWLRREKGEHIMTKQLLRSATSIGANVAEAQGAISKADFATKIYIAYKEGKETRYWLDLLHNTNYLNDNQHQSIIADMTEIEKLLTAITKKVRGREGDER